MQTIAAVSLTPVQKAVQAVVAPLAPLGADDWTEDEVMGRNLGDGNVDWCVDILDGDVVRVFAAGDVVAEAVIPGASTL